MTDNVTLENVNENDNFSRRVWHQITTDNCGKTKVIASGGRKTDY